MRRQEIISGSISRNQRKRLDKYTQIASSVFATDLAQAKRIQAGDWIEIEYISKLGNKKKQLLRVVEKIIRPKIDIVIFIVKGGRLWNLKRG